MQKEVTPVKGCSYPDAAPAGVRDEAMLHINAPLEAIRLLRGPHQLDVCCHSLKGIDMMPERAELKGAGANVGSHIREPPPHH